MQFKATYNSPNHYNGRKGYKPDMIVCHVTYFRDLRRYVLSLTSIEDINSIEYGYELSENDKSDVLKTYEVMMNSETAT